MRGNKKEQVNEWEKQWDEDDDDSEDEQADRGHDYDDDDEQDGGVAGAGAMAPSHSAAAVAAAASASASARKLMPQHQLRPGMDVGHSNIPVPLEMSSWSSSAAATGGGSAIVSQQQQQQQQHGHLVTSEPQDLLSNPPNLAVPNAAMSSYEDDDGVEWDTGMVQKVVDGHVKPDVQMFLPMLRVLGKGSFGKVRFLHCCTRYTFSNHICIYTPHPHPFNVCRLYWSKSASERNVVVYLP